MQKLSNNFFLATLWNGEEILLSGEMKIAIRIRPGGYIPRSGFLLADEICKQQVSGRVLDIGTGESGILANCLLARGASEVLASDIDLQAIQWAQQASNRSCEIAWHNCDLFPSEQVSGTFNTIVSNPPQMPMPYSGHYHDYGGPDGRCHIIRIIEGARRLLEPSGKLFLLCFDLLGIERACEQATIVEIAQENGLKTKILARYDRQLRKGGKTEENIGWIESVYPEYNFRKNAQGNYYHEMLILEMSNVLISS